MNASQTEKKPPGEREAATGRQASEAKGTENQTPPTQPLYGLLQEAVKLLDWGAALPRVTSVQVNHQGIWLTPWIEGAPITAILGWAKELNSPNLYFQVMDPECTLVHFHGIWRAQHVHLTASTYRPLLEVGPGEALAELQRVAAQETPFAPRL